MRAYQMGAKTFGTGVEEPFFQISVNAGLVRRIEWIGNQVPAAFIGLYLIGKKEVGQQ